MSDIDVRVMEVGECRPFGNYRVCHEGDDNGKWIVCTSVHGDWKVSWRDDNPMYGVMLSYTKDNSLEAYLSALFTLMMLATSHNHDALAIINGDGSPFMDGFSKLWNDQIVYELSFVKPVSRNADERMLKEAVDFENLRDDINGLTGEEDG